MTADSFILNCNADGPKPEYKHFLGGKTTDIPEKKEKKQQLENIIVHGLKCEKIILIFLSSVRL